MSAVTRLRKIYTYARWGLKAPRYAGKLLRSSFSSRHGPTTAQGVRALPHNPLYEEMRAHGFSALPNAPFVLPSIDIGALAGKARNTPFYNALGHHWEELKPLICDVLCHSQISDLLLRYFDGKPWLWNVALNYSEATDSLQDSQLWHFDYGDIKQLHVMLYFSDVDYDSGPFTFLPAGTSDKVPRSKLRIERFTDRQLYDDHGIDVSTTAVRLTGGERDCFFADPGRTLHQGARCRKHRLVLFLTFTTPTPMSSGGARTLRRSERVDLYRHYRTVTAGSQMIFSDKFFL
jgi:hypothetical protein